MSYYYDTPFFGMHFFWWIAWIIIWVGLFSIWTPVPRTRWRKIQASPLEILQRRLANGEIDAEDYEKRKVILERDVNRSSASVGKSTNWKLRTQ